VGKNVKGLLHKRGRRKAGGAEQRKNATKGSAKGGIPLTEELVGLRQAQKLHRQGKLLEGALSKGFETGKKGPPELTAAFPRDRGETDSGSRKVENQDQRGKRAKNYTKAKAGACMRKGGNWPGLGGGQKGLGDWGGHNQLVIRRDGTQCVTRLSAKDFEMF